MPKYLASVLFALSSAILIYSLFAGKLLSDQDYDASDIELIPASDICHPLTGSNARLEIAVRLLQANQCQWLTLLGGKEGKEQSYAARKLEVALSMGAPRHQIILNETDIFSTYSELETLAEATSRLMSAQAKILLVTDEFHTRRVGIVANWIWEDPDHHSIVAVPPQFGETSFLWWLSAPARGITLREHLKLAYYYAAYRFPVSRVRDWVLQFERIND